MNPAHLAAARRLVHDVLNPMKRAFVDKDEIIDLMGLALVARQNLFLHGPPGTAKSALVQDLARRLAGRSFDYLLTRFTEPSELFGPFDIRKLREGDLVTNTEGMLPEASIVFLDELLNANSAILNSLLGVLNERVLRRGRDTIQLPLLMVVGASNHLPEDEALKALFDRFLLRVRSENVDDARLGDVLDAGWSLEARREKIAEPSISVHEIEALSSALTEVELDEARAPLADLVRAIRAAGIALSDRRAVKMQRAVAASALLAGRAAALPSDLWVFRYAWETLEQGEVLAGLVGQALDDADQSTAHPRAHVSAAPDPDAIAAEVAALEASAGDAAVGEGETRADRIQLLSSRTEWIANEVTRDHLLGRLAALLVAVSRQGE